MPKVRSLSQIREQEPAPPKRRAVKKRRRPRGDIVEQAEQTLQRANALQDGVTKAGRRILALVETEITEAEHDPEKLDALLGKLGNILGPLGDLAKDASTAGRTSAQAIKLLREQGPASPREDDDVSAEDLRDMLKGMGRK